MERFLPNSKSSAISYQLSDNHRKGFTLIELLVVISIIAILAVIGMVMLGGLQGRARDAERRVEVDALLKAYEIKFEAATGRYPDEADIVAGDFADGEIPTPPNYDKTNPSDGEEYTVTPGEGNKTIEVCATLENGPPHCKSGAQGSTGASQACTTNFPQNCRASVSSGNVPSNAYIACPLTALSCNVSDSAPLITGVQYWTDPSGGTPATGTMSIYPVSGNSFTNVLINKHQ